jgi:hypothetical protein
MNSFKCIPNNTMPLKLDKKRAAMKAALEQVKRINHAILKREISVSS